MSISQTITEFSGLLQTHLYTVGDVRVSAGRLLLAGAVILFFFVLSHFIKRSIRRILNKKGVKSEQTIGTTCTFTHYIVMILGTVIALKIAGIDLSTIFAAGAVLTVGLGFAMQTIAQNFVSGIILFVERSIQAGDILEVDSKVVKVLKIGVRSTLAATRNNEEMIIPNSNIVQGTVINYTMSDSKYLLSTVVGVSYDSDMTLVKQTLQTVAESMKWRIPDGRASVLLKEFGDSSVNFGVYVEASDPWQGRKLTSELNESIWWALKKADMTIAYPQLDVHLKSSVK